MGDLTESMTPSSATPHSRPLPIREDCWSEEATATLVDAWGRRYLELNRGNLRQKDWQEVADAVNAKHGHTKKTHRTDVQCKNRIDTIKKKYKIEKARVSSSDGTFTSAWPFFESLDALIGSNFSAKKQPPQPQLSPSLPSSPPVALPIVPSYHRRTPVQVPISIPIPPTAITASASPAGILPQKRSLDEGYFRRHYSAMAAAAAAAEAAETDSEEEEEEEEEEGAGVERESEEDEEGEGIKKLAKAIERFGEVYERVECQKLRQMVDLEKQRMKFAKDLEMERMRIFTETQIQLEKIKKGKRSSEGMRVEIDLVEVERDNNMELSDSSISSADIDLSEGVEFQKIFPNLKTTASTQFGELCERDSQQLPSRGEEGLSRGLKLATGTGKRSRRGSRLGQSWV